MEVIVTPASGTGFNVSVNIVDPDLAQLAADAEAAAASAAASAVEAGEAASNAENSAVNSANSAREAAQSAIDAENAAESVRKVIYNTPYLYPDWWDGYRIPISIKNSASIINFDVSSLINLDYYVPYYISPTGNNSNDGLGIDTPKASVSNAISSGAELIYMLPGNYSRDTFIPSNFNSNAIIIGVGDVNISQSQTGLSWTLIGNNTYRTSRSLVTNVIDYNFYNQYGYYKNLKEVTSQGECESESGTYYTDNVDLYVHTQDNRFPDSEIAPILNIGSSILSNDKRIYLENITFYGYELRAIGSDSSSNLRVFCKNIRIPLLKKGVSTSPQLFNIFTINNAKLAIFQDCVGIESSMDIYNYHNTANIGISNVVEINCKGFNAGIGQLEVNNQCSSAHDSVRILRINCDYYGGDAQVVADVGTGTKTIMVGCELNINPQQNATSIYRGVDADIFGCKLLGVKLIVEGDSNTGIGIKISNSIVQNSGIIGNVTINN